VCEAVAYALAVLEKDIRRILRRDVPDAYTPLIAKMKFFIEPEVSCSRFFAEACFTEEGLQNFRAGTVPPLATRTELCSVLAERLQGAIWIDIPCGLHAVRDQERDWDLIPLVRTLDIAAYWEADITADVVRDRIQETTDVTAQGTSYTLGWGLRAIGLRDVDGLPVATMQDDLLGFIAKLPWPGNRPPLALYLSGIQPDATLCATHEGQRDIVVPYLQALYQELERACGPEDVLILNSAAMLGAGIDEEKFPAVHPAVALFQRGFTLLRRCPYDKVHVYVRQ
jgi:hypothetical protein